MPSRLLCSVKTKVPSISPPFFVCSLLNSSPCASLYYGSLYAAQCFLILRLEILYRLREATKLTLSLSGLSQQQTEVATSHLYWWHLSRPSCWWVLQRHPHFILDCQQHKTMQCASFCLDAPKAHLNLTIFVRFLGSPSHRRSLEQSCPLLSPLHLHLHLQQLNSRDTWCNLRVAECCSHGQQLEMLR